LLQEIVEDSEKQPGAQSGRRHAIRDERSLKEASVKRAMLERDFDIVIDKVGGLTHAEQRAEKCLGCRKTWLKNVARDRIDLPTRGFSVL
jgi:NADPH:quinone reductase-like Zn-dependent oxidoreductase